MPHKLFWTRPYLANQATRVVSVNGPAVVLEETIFFPFSGGQESDAGTIAGHPVLQARKFGLEVEYLLADDHGLNIGDKVDVQIDWQRRYKLMRLHFAAELVLVLISKKLAQIEKVGAHIAADKARIDFAWPTSLASLLPDITAEAQAIVQQDRQIVSAFSDKQNGKRYWEVEGFARVPCGGTHLTRTGEVGEIRLKRKNPGQGKERVEIYLQEE